MITPQKNESPEYFRNQGFMNFCGAQNRNRTCTHLRELVPETSASTSSAIWAF